MDDRTQHQQQPAADVAALMTIGPAADAPHSFSSTPGRSKGGEMHYPRFAGYDITGRLGEGGMGVVWRAVQRSTRREVALKVMGAAGVGSERARLRFEREVELSARLDHPGIAKVFDGGLDAGLCYYAMELVDGVPLDRYVTERALPPRQIVQLMRDISRAVQHAHLKGIIHRDLKPSNILITGEGQPKVLDFGLAKALEGTDGPQVSLDGDIAGTPVYMSPEQAMGRLDQIDTRCDVYTLGVILFRLLAEDFPHDSSGSAMELMRRIGTTEPRRLRQLNPLADRELEAILARALAHDPVRRYGSAGELADDLDRYLSGEPVVARAPTVTYLLRKKVRKHRLPITIAAAVALALAGAGVWAYVGVTRERNIALAANVEKDRQRAEAIRQTHEAQTQRAQAIKHQFDAQNQRSEAIKQKTEAEKQTTQAQENARQARRRLAGQFTREAWAKAESGDPSGALPWLVRALEEVVDDPSEAAAMRVRIGTTLRRCPRPSELGSDAVPEFPPHRVHGDRILVISSKKVVIQDRTTGKPLTQEMRHQENIISAEFSVDGSRVVTTSHDLTTQVWDSASGHAICPPFRAQEHGEPYRAHFSPDGSGVVTTWGDKARIWDVKTAQPLTPPLHYPGGVADAAFSVDGTRIVLAATTGAYVLNSTTGQPVTARLRHDSRVLSASFSPDGNRVVTASADRTARIWDATTGQPITMPLRHDLDVRAAAFSPDGKQVVTGSRDKTARVWDAATGQPLTPPLRHEKDIAFVAFTSDGNRIMASGEDGKSRFWDLTSCLLMPPAARWGKQTVHRATFSPDHSKVVVALSNSGAVVLDSALGQALTPYMASENKWECVSALFSCDGRYILTRNSRNFTDPSNGSRITRGEARVWDAATGKPLSPLLKHDGSVEAVAFSPDSAVVATAGDDHTAKLWDALTGAMRTPPLQHNGRVFRVAFSPDGLRLLTGSDHGARLWNAKTGSPFPERLSMKGLFATFSPDGHRIATATDRADRHGRVWDTMTGQPLTPPLQHEDEVRGIIFNADGTLVLTHSADHTARVWDATTGQPITPPLRHDHSVKCAAFSPDSRKVATGDSSGRATPGTVRIWNAATGEPLAPPLWHENAINSVEFNLDGSKLLTSSNGVWLWDISADERPLADLRTWAELLSGQRLDQTDAVIPLTGAEWRARWEELRAKYPGEFNSAKVR